MPFYSPLFLRIKDKTILKRTVENLLILRKALKKAIPERTLSKTLLLATWNIRDFDKPAFGDRSEESIYYIAEIIASFDIIAIQEVYKDLRGLERVKEVLGSNWDYVFSDPSEGSRGNNECMAFLYDKRKVQFGGLAGELVIPYDKNNPNVEQIWRTPMICGFKAGWAKFMLCSVHIQWGSGSGLYPESRIEEIRAVAEFLKKRTMDETAWARKLILVGDFNTPSTEDAVFQPLLDAGFRIPNLLNKVKTNALMDKHYDQIVFREKEDSLKFLNGGAFNFFDTVYKMKDEKNYADEIGPNYLTKTNGTKRTKKEKTSYYKMWRTHQMSDHLPLWTEFEIDFADEYLENKFANNL